MITLNILSILKGTFSNKNFYVKTVDNSEQSMRTNSLTSALNNNLMTTELNADLSTSTPGGVMLLIGSGSTPATRNDITLESFLTSYQVVSQTCQKFDDYGDTVYVINRIVKNNTESNMSISEIGLFVSDTSHTNLYVNYMLSRETLNEPIVLAPGESHSFTMTIGLE